MTATDAPTHLNIPVKNPPDLLSPDTHQDRVWLISFFWGAEMRKRPNDGDPLCMLPILHQVIIIQMILMGTRGRNIYLDRPMIPAHLVVFQLKGDLKDSENVF